MNKVRESGNDAETTGTGPLFGFVVLVVVIARCKHFFERLFSNGGAAPPPILPASL